jgi:hypothetical protein
LAYTLGNFRVLEKDSLKGDKGLGAANYSEQLNLPDNQQRDVFVGHKIYSMIRILNGRNFLPLNGVALRESTMRK